MRVRNRFTTITALASAAVAAAFAIPAAASAEPVALLAGGAGNPTLSLLDTARPQEVSQLPITGVGAGEVVAGIDVRPATGVLYAVTLEDTGAARTGRLYTINLATGAATIVGTNFSTTLDDTANVSIDFNPTVDRLRVVSDVDDNLRVNPNGGALVLADTDLDRTGVAAIAYDRNAAGATVTTLYGIDESTDELITIGGINSTPSPNLGAVTTVAALGGATVGVDTGLDISSASNTAYLIGGATKQLRTVNLTSGVTTLIPGSFLGDPFDIAVLAPSTIGFAAATASAEERNGRLDVTVTRTGSTQVAGAVDYTTVDGTAKAGSDYTAVAGTLKFAVGETTKTISIPLTDDGTGDAGELFTVALTNVSGASLGTAVQTVTVVETQVADKTAPNLVVADLGIKGYRYFYPNGLYTTFSCDEACKVVYTVRLGTSTYIAKSTGELTKAGVGEIKAPNTLLGKARLSKAMKSSKSGKLVALFAIAATDANGYKKTVTRKFQIVR